MSVQAIEEFAADATLEQLRKTLQFDASFNEEFRILRPNLGKITQHWSFQMSSQLTEHLGAMNRMDSVDAGKFDQLMKTYVREMRTGRFYVDFAAAVEGLADFFIERNVKLSWLVGAYLGLFYEAQLAIFFDRKSEEARVVVSALRCLLKIMTLTIQILNARAFKRLEDAFTELKPY